MSENLQYLIMVRHGESEGDARRAAWARGETVTATKPPELEEITDLGVEQCRQAGLWIQKHIIEAYGLPGFDGCYVSSAIRSEQSAIALDLPIAVWQDDNCLDERNRGSIRGMHPAKHKQLHPESYEQMKSDPLRWVPPDGESMMAVVERAGQFMENVEGSRNVLAVTHRDWMWAAGLLLERLTEEEFLAVNTDEIHNGQILVYSTIDPISHVQADGRMWKLSVDPMEPESSEGWQAIDARARAA